MTAGMPAQPAFDFAKYRIKDPQSEQGQLGSETPHGAQNGNVVPSEPFDFAKFRVAPPPTATDEFKRHVARTGARVGETIAGFPGDIVNFSKFLGSKLPEVPSALQGEDNFVKKAGRKALESIPSSADLKDFTSYLTSGFTDPKSAAEELGDDVTSLATVLINPSKAAAGFPSLLKNIGTSALKAFGVKSAGKGAEALGATPNQQAATEMGALFLTGLMGEKTADKFIGEQYQKARSQIPPGTRVNTAKLEKELAGVETQLNRGVSTATKKEVLTPLQELKAKASTGTMELDEVVESLHNINEKMNSKKLFDELSSSERKLLKSRYDLLKDKVHEEIASYGQHNPEFYNTWKNANQGFATIAESKKISNFLQSKLGKIPHHLAGSIALDIFLGQPASVLGVGGAYGAVKAGELIYRIAKSEPLRDHYMKVLMEAANENLPGAVKHLNAIDKEAKKIQNESESEKQRT